MMQDDSPQTSDTTANNTDGEPSAVVRNLGLIKAASVIMGVLIIILSAVVIATVISRLSQTAPPEAELSITVPAGVEVLSASADDDGLTLLVDAPSGREIWRISPSGERYQTIRLVTE